MIRLHNNPESILSYDKNFIVLKGLKDKEEYVFYNTKNNIAIRLNKLEFSLLELMYKYEDIDYISSFINSAHKDQIRELLLSLNENNIFSHTQEDDSPNNIDASYELQYPSVYYLHLTDNCNLDCTYCYNKQSRINKKDLSVDKWLEIIDKISPYAKRIILTGGECFLYKEIGQIIRYIKDKKPDIYLVCISNGMHNFERKAKLFKLELIDYIMFSCDSISEEGDRIGFNPDIFISSVNFIRENYPTIDVEISATRTSKNQNNLSEIKCFSQRLSCQTKFINLIPNELSDICNMPKPTSCLQDVSIIPIETELKHISSRAKHCGAARNICSIDSHGYVYPCQSLHYDEFFMGNILDNSSL